MSFPSSVESLRQSGSLTEEDMVKLSSIKETMLEKLGEGREAFCEFVKSEFADGDEMDEVTFNKIAEAFEAYEKIAIGKVVKGGGRGINSLKAALAIAQLGVASVIPASIGLSWLSRRNKMKSSFDTVIKAHPELEGDPNVKQHWNVLTDYAPDIAANPMVAGTLLRRMKNWGEVDHQTVKDLIAMQKDINQGQVGYGGAMDPSRAIGSIGQALSGKY